jgi:hypothetical protein
LDDAPWGQPPVDVRNLRGPTDRIGLGDLVIVMSVPVNETPQEVKARVLAEKPGPMGYFCSV